MTGAARSTDPDTSLRAALSVNATQLERRVYRAIYSCGARGATWAEQERLLPDVSRQAISPRWVKLRERKLIVDSGERRPGWSNRTQIVWKAAEFVEPWE